MPVLLHQSQRGQQDGIVEVDQRSLAEEAVRDAMRLVLVHRQHALVELGLGRQLGVFPQQYV